MQNRFHNVSMHWVDFADFYVKKYNCVLNFKWARYIPVALIALYKNRTADVQFEEHADFANCRFPAGLTFYRKVVKNQNFFNKI